MLVSEYGYTIDETLTKIAMKSTNSTNPVVAIVRKEN
jgi:hypothetical protein